MGSDLAQLQFRIYSRLGDEALAYLATGLLPSLGFTDEMTAAYVNCVKAGEAKEFRNLIRVRFRCFENKVFP